MIEMIKSDLNQPASLFHHKEVCDCVVLYVYRDCDKTMLTYIYLYFLCFFLNRLLFYLSHKILF